MITDEIRIFKGDKLTLDSELIYADFDYLASSGSRIRLLMFNVF